MKKVIPPSEALRAAVTVKALGLPYSCAISYIKWLTGLSDEKLKAFERPMKAEYDKEKQAITSPERIKMRIYSSYPDLKFNKLTREIELGGIAATDNDLNEIFIKVLDSGVKCSKDLVITVLYSNWVPAYSPFEELFSKHSKTPPANPNGHIEALINCIETDTLHADVFIKKWLVSIIESLFGKHSPLVLVLCGKQNTGKTHFFRYLLPEPLNRYYTDSRLDYGKDSEILMTKKLIISDDEFGGKSKEEIKRLKELTSKQVFSIREPYGRKSQDLRRLAVLCGTTNEEQILNHPTGNRRIIPLNVISINQAEYNAVDKELLLYELYLEYCNGFESKLSQSEIDQLNVSSEAFKVTSIEEEMIAMYFGHPKDRAGYPIQELTNTEILLEIKRLTGEALDPTKLGRHLKALGFMRINKRVKGISKGVYSVVLLDQGKLVQGDLLKQMRN